MTTTPPEVRPRLRNPSPAQGFDGRTAVVVRIAGLSTRVPVRAVVVTLALAALTAVVFVWSLAVGDYPIPVGDVVATLFGNDSGGADFVVRTLRLPRGLTAVLVGAAFGLSGAVLQRLVRNPLASPDLIGINAGAAAAACYVVVVLRGTNAQVATGAVLGALVAATALYGLAYRRGVTSYRLVLVGIGITAVLVATTNYLLTEAEIYEVQRAFLWLTGSLNGRGWDHLRPVALALAVLVPVTIALARQLRLLELGDDLARGLGGRLERTRLALLLCGVLLAATGTAAAGPIGFVALAGPQVARRLVGGGSLALVPAAVCGALLLVSADLVARRTFAPTELPVGVVTGVVGAPYLLYLLARSNRIGAGG